MRFMTLWRPGKNPNPRSDKLDQQMGALIGEMAKAGVLIQTGGWDPSGPCLTMKSSNGKISLTDGPFTESKELVAGFCMMNVKSKDEALAWTRKFLELAGDGNSEIRELPEF